MCKKNKTFLKQSQEFSVNFLTDADTIRRLNYSVKNHPV